MILLLHKHKNGDIQPNQPCLTFFLQVIDQVSYIAKCNKGQKIKDKKGSPRRSMMESSYKYNIKKHEKNCPAPD